MKLWTLLFVAGCAHGRIDRLEARVTSLEADVARLQGEPLAPGADQEQAATALLDQASLGWDVDADAAKATSLLDQLHTRFPGTRADARGERLRKELSVVGKDVTPLSVEWVSGSTTWDASPVTLVVFFEEWCPHCAEEMPKLAERSADLQSKGVQVVGLTRLTHSTTMEQLTSFLTAKQIHFPIGREDGTLSKQMEVTGIPAAVLVRAGKVIWRGHPARLDDEKLKQILKH